MGAQLPAGRVVGGHLGGQLRRDAHALLGHQQVEALGVEHHPVARPRCGTGSQKSSDPVAAHLGHVEQRGVVAGPVADPPVGVAAQVEGQEQPVGGGELPLRRRPPGPVEERLMAVQLDELGVAEAGTGRP